MTFSNLYSIVLSPFVQDFKDAANDKGRKTVVSEAVKAVKASKEVMEDSEDLPNDLNLVSIPLCSFPFDLGMRL
jgi:hypothetical protein